MPKSRTLKQFAKDQKRAACPVCKLPGEAREQLRGASDSKISREVQLAWLAAEHSSTVTMEDLDRHRSERHDSQ